MKYNYGHTMLRPYSVFESKGFLFPGVLCKKFSSALNQSTGVTENSKKSHVKGDLVGQPHPVSNLRPVCFFIPENESVIEKRFREERESVHQWNQEFWMSHNNKFIEERKAYVIAHNELKGEDSTISADQMSEFYKAFLDKNWKTHFHYNITWYKKNANLVVLEVRVKLYRLMKKLGLSTKKE